MKLMPKTACDISYAYDAKGRLASAVPVYHYYLQDHLENPGHSMIHEVNVRQISRITGVCFEVIHRAKRESAKRPLIQIILFSLLLMLISSCNNENKQCVEFDLRGTTWQLIRVEFDDHSTLIPHYGLVVTFNDNGMCTFDIASDTNNTVKWSVFHDTLFIQNSELKYGFFESGSYPIIINNNELIIKKEKEKDIYFKIDHLAPSFP